jgi:hypothetical protein
VKHHMQVIRVGGHRSCALVAMGLTAIAGGAGASHIAPFGEGVSSPIVIPNSVPAISALLGWPALRVQRRSPCHCGGDCTMRCS